jgi:hypothetical protein
LKQSLEKRNFYKETNTRRITELVNCYEALCSTAYDAKVIHKSWMSFTGKLGYDNASYTMDDRILMFKGKIDAKIEYLVNAIERGLDKQGS